MDWRAVQAGIVESTAGDRQRGEHPIKTRVPDVRERNALADSRRPQLVAADQRGVKLRDQRGRKKAVKRQLVEDGPKSLVTVTDAGVIEHQQALNALSKPHRTTLPCQTFSISQSAIGRALSKG